MKYNSVKSYLLFVFHNFKDNPDLPLEIAFEYEPLISSKYIKFNYGDNSMVCYFESDVPFIELEEFSHNLLVYENCQFFIMEVNNNLATNLTTELKLHLFDLNNDNEELSNLEFNSNDANTNSINWVSNITNEEMIIYYINKDDDEDDFDLISSLKQPKTSLDDILDKIQEKGLSSLSETEKQTLNEYGKRN